MFLGDQAILGVGIMVFGIMITDGSMFRYVLLFSLSLSLFGKALTVCFVSFLSLFESALS